MNKYIKNLEDIINNDLEALKIKLSMNIGNLYYEMLEEEKINKCHEKETMKYTYPKACPFKLVQCNHSESWDCLLDKCAIYNNDYEKCGLILCRQNE